MSIFRDFCGRFFFWNLFTSGIEPFCEALCFQYEEPLKYENRFFDTDFILETFSLCCYWFAFLEHWLMAKIRSLCAYKCDITSSEHCRIQSNLFVFWLLLFRSLNPLNPELNPICNLLALLGAHHFLHVSRIRVKLLTFRLLMSYIYGAPILDVSRSHTTTQHSR